MSTTHSLEKIIQRRAKKAFHFEKPATAAAILDVYRDFQKEQIEFIKDQHREGATGLEVARAITSVVDALVYSLAERAFSAYREQKNGSDPSIAIVAIGGYGRAELCPLSDVDLMFLYPSNTSPNALSETQEFMVQRILYPLWDIGLKVGHSSRTIDDIFSEARKDIQTKTALLESRLIYGSPPLYEGFQSSYNLFYRKENPKGYIQQRLVDQRERRARFGGSVYMQEPDIKNGVGGLRDYHNTFWMARVRLNVKSMEGLVELNYLRKDELAAFKDAHNFLLKARNELHFRSKRPTDLLSLETQPKVALRLGYRERNLLKRVEDFMRDYYRHAETIYRISKTVESRMALNSQPDSKANPLKSMKNFLLARRKERLRQIDGFLIRGREISFENNKVFAEDPNRLIRVFRHGQKLDLDLDIELKALIQGSLDLIDSDVVHSPDANSSFRAILQESGSVYKSLESMRELGVLGKFVPEWDRLTCLVQHEYYHRYTADIHTLHTIRELDTIFTSPDPLFKPYREELHELRLPNILYLILFLHDIGKGDSIKGHAETGVTVAEPILDRMQVDEENRILIRFVIRNHLQMVRFWQRYDIDDPETAKLFADQTETPEQLRLLYVHTFCDARGTAKGLWNNYKNTLHTTLFRHALHSFESEGKVEEQYKRHKEAALQAMLESKSDQIRTEEINAHFQLLPDRYFINTPQDEVALHISMVNQLLREIATSDSSCALNPIIDWREDINRSLSVVNVATWDRAGLFHKLAGSLNIAGYSILGAKAISRDDNIAIDTFYVVESDRRERSVGDAAMIFEECLKDTLIANADLYPVLNNIMKQASEGIFYKNDNPLANSFQPQVEFHYEPALNQTILEIQAPDHLGLLYSLAKSIFESGLDITFARISTERGIAIDTFHIKDPSSADGQIKEDILDGLKESILQFLAKEERLEED